jgi:hypothetical protein
VVADAPSRVCARSAAHGADAVIGTVKPRPGAMHDIGASRPAHGRAGRKSAVLNCLSSLMYLMKGAAMTGPRILDELGAKLSELAASSPARDIEKNMKALLGSAFGKLDLITREEFDVQREVLAHTRQKLVELEERVATLESELVRARASRDAE